MGGMLLVFFILLYLDAYVGVIDKYNGKVEATVHVVIWLFFALYLVVNILFGGGS